MSDDMDWSLDFCLACDRQTDGQTYCSESCRLAEYEKASSNPSSTASSPRTPSGLPTWPVASASKHQSPFFMEPAYDFRSPRPYTARTPSTTQAPSFFTMQRPRLTPISTTTTSTTRGLTPSTSYTSLRSMQSSACMPPAEPLQLSDESRKALRAYASAFDQSRYTRRQSAN